jgi:hypothetical protein
VPALPHSGAGKLDRAALPTVATALRELRFKPEFRR